MITSLISVVIPTYNSAQLLPSALESVIRQTYPNVEIIVADDGSNDNTVDVVQSYGGHVKYRYISHSGLPAVTRNAALQLAEGEYIAFLDADDAWLPEKLERQLAAMLQNNCLASSTNAWRLRKGEIESPYFDQLVPEQLTFHDLLVVNLVICSSAIVHRSVFHVTGHFPEVPTLKAGEDYALWLRVATQTNWVYLSEPLTRYSDMPSQSVRRDSVSVFEQNRRVFGDFKTWAESTHIAQPFRWQVRKRLIANSMAETRQALSRLLRGKRT